MNSAHGTENPTNKCSKKHASVDASEIWWKLNKLKWTNASQLSIIPFPPQTSSDDFSGIYHSPVDPFSSTKI